MAQQFTGIQGLVGKQLQQEIRLRGGSQQKLVAVAGFLAGAGVVWRAWPLNRFRLARLVLIFTGCVLAARLANRLLLFRLAARGPWLERAAAECWPCKDGEDQVCGKDNPRHSGHQG